LRHGDLLLAIRYIECRFLCMFVAQDSRKGKVCKHERANAAL